MSHTTLFTLATPRPFYINFDDIFLGITTLKHIPTIAGNELEKEVMICLTRTRHITKPRIQVSRPSTRNWVQIGKLLFMRTSTACRKVRESVSLLLLLLLLLSLL